MMKKHLFLIMLIISSCTEIELEELTLTQEIQASKLLVNSGSCSFSYGNGSDNQPIGGGNGYTDMVSEQNAQYVVSNLADLKTAVQNAIEGDTIFIKGIIEFTVPGEILHITKQVTLAGSRGSGSCGAVIKTGLFGTYESEWLNNSKSSSYPIIKVSNTANVRITGLQFEGPFGGTEVTGPRKLKHGIRIENSQNILIDNCEFRDWPYSAINVGSDATDNIVIKNSYFHDNVQHGLGYGVAIADNAFALVKNNVFDNNRHDISCSGLQDSGYEFSFNVCGQGSHPNVDTHGEKDLKQNPTNLVQDRAGSFFYVHHNLFLGDSTANILVRGIPEKLFMIEKNKFVHDHAADAIYHYAKKNNVYYNYDKNVFAFNNSYSADYQGYFVSRNYRKNQKIVNLPQNPTLINSSFPALANPYQVMDFAIGDFNGDGLNQIFINENQRWKAIDYPKTDTMHLNSSNRTNYVWKDLGGSSIPPSNLRIGDFDGDNHSDVFKANGTNWAISYYDSNNHKLQGWQVVVTSDLGLDELKFGDFNDNGTTDTFWADGTDWFLSDGGSSNEVDINTSGFDHTKLGTGMFKSSTPNTSMDLFAASGGNWKFVNGGRGGWNILKSSPVGFASLLQFDIDNDGITDIIEKNGYSYKVSEKGKSDLKDLNTMEFPSLFEDW